MNRLTEALDALGGPARLPDSSAEAVLLSLLLAFVLGQAIAWAYLRTHSGLTYSRSFTQSLVLITMVVALVMNVIGDSLVTAFGLIGALAIVRFRNVLKDTRDTVFVFFGLVLGLAVGVQKYEAAIVGTAVLILVSFYLHLTAFGSRGRFDGHLTCHVAGDEDEPAGFRRTLRAFCRRYERVSVRAALGGPDDAGGATELVFQVRLRDRRRGPELLQALREVPDVGDATLILRDELGEL